MSNVSGNTPYTTSKAPSTSDITEKQFADLLATPGKIAENQPPGITELKKITDDLHIDKKTLFGILDGSDGIKDGKFHVDNLSNFVGLVTGAIANSYIKQNDYADAAKVLAMSPEAENYFQFLTAEQQKKFADAQSNLQLTTEEKSIQRDTTELMHRHESVKQYQAREAIAKSKPAQDVVAAIGQGDLAKAAQIIMDSPDVAKILEYLHGMTLFNIYPGSGNPNEDFQIHEKLVAAIKARADALPAGREKEKADALVVQANDLISSHNKAQEDSDCSSLIKDIKNGFFQNETFGKDVLKDLLERPYATDLLNRIKNSPEIDVEQLKTFASRLKKQADAMAAGPDKDKVTALVAQVANFLPTT